MTAESVSDFPELSLQDLRTIVLGNYQIKQARSHYAEHIRVDGMYELQVCIHAERLPLEKYDLLTGDNSLVRIRK